MIRDVKWLFGDQIIHVISEDEVTVEELLSLANELDKMYTQSKADKIHLIISEENLKSLPKSLKGFQQGTRFLRHDRIGWFLLYGNMGRNKLVQLLGAVVINLSKVRHNNFETLDECLEFLISMDPNLPAIEELKEGIIV